MAVGLDEHRFSLDVKTLWTKKKKNSQLAAGQDAQCMNQVKKKGTSENEQ